MEDIFVRCSTIADSLTKAGYKQVMQVLTDVFINSGVHVYWANGSRLIRVCSKDMFSVYEIERVNTGSKIVTLYTTYSKFMFEFYEAIIHPDSEEFLSVLDAFNNVLYYSYDNITNKKYKLDRVLSDYPELRKVLCDAYSDNIVTPDIKLNPYDFYIENNTSSIGYVIATDNDGFLFQEISGISKLRYCKVNELDKMTLLPDMHDRVRMLLHNTMCAFRDFLEYSRVMKRLEYIGYTFIDSMFNMNNSYDFSDCSVGISDAEFQKLWYVTSSNLLVIANLDYGVGFLKITDKSETFTEVSPEVMFESVKPCNYLATIKLIATQILIRFAPVLADDDKTVKYLENLVRIVSELDKIDVNANMGWETMQESLAENQTMGESTIIKQNKQGILSRAVAFED